MKMDPDPNPNHEQRNETQNCPIIFLLFLLIIMVKLDEPFRDPEIFIISKDPDPSTG